MRIYNSPDWLKVFKIAESNSSIIKTCTFIYGITRGTFFGRLYISLYAICFAAYCSLGSKLKGQAVFLKFHSNEKEALLKLETICGKDLEIKLINNSTRTIFDTLCAFFICLGFLPRLMRDLKLHHELSFFAICQHALILASWRLYIVTLNKIKPRFVAASTTSLPQAVALILAAKALRIPTVYCAHGMFADFVGQQPPLADFLFLTNLISEEALREVRKDTFHVSLWGWDTVSNPIRLPNSSQKNLKIGFFPSTPLNLDGVSESIRKVMVSKPNATLILRLHPMNFIPRDEILEKLPDISIDTSPSLESLINNSDLAIVGNSSVLPQSLRGGTPVIYDSNLDIAPRDVLGFIKNGIAVEMEDDFTDAIEKISLYKTPEWLNCFRSFDPFYELDSIRGFNECRQEFIKWLNKSC